MGGVNAAADVKAVQGLINQISMNFGGPLKPIAVDGIVGPETIGAINRFQSRNFGWSDGRVDPNGKTLAKLDSVAGMSGIAPPNGAPKPNFGPKNPATPSGAGQPGMPTNIDGASTGNNWAMITSVTGKVKMRFPGGSFVQAFPGFFLPPGSVLMTYDATGCPLNLDLTPQEMREPYPFKPGSASVKFDDGTTRSFGPYSLFVVR